MMIKNLVHLIYLSMSFVAIKANSPTTFETLHGASPDPNCTGDCVYVNRYMSIFPLRSPEDTNHNLMVPNYKVIMFTKDNLIIFDSDT